MSHGSKFHIDVSDAREILEAKGYLVELRTVHGHYMGSDGETYNQTGYAITVFPYKSKGRKEGETKT